MKNPFLSQSEFENIFKYHLKVTSYSMSIRSLFSDRMLRKIDYQPYYQRNYVWDETKATFFIESILLGTDIPPLVFFNSGGKYEVIDGRQRFETIERFKSLEFSLKSKGLLDLPQLKGKNYNALSDDFIDLFEDVKLRIFEFEVINEPRLEQALEDRIKKEIFRRYNSGITSLNSAEIDNAVYDNDPISMLFRKKLSKNASYTDKIKICFSLGKKTDTEGDFSKVLQFLRKNFVLVQFPISHYARTGSRTETLQLLYEIASQNFSEGSSQDDIDDAVKRQFNNLEEVLKLRDYFIQNGYEGNRIMYECVLWAINVMCMETGDNFVAFSEEHKKKLLKFYKSHADLYDVETYHYYKSIIERFKNTGKIFNSIFGIDFSIYLKDDDFNERVKGLRQNEVDVLLKMEELETLRVNKPEPSSIPIHQLSNDLSTNRYMIRPSYQRQERINVKKASAIIESIILGIYLPPLFIYKNKDNVKEVIDGQQRILAVLGFLDKEYLNENRELVRSKNNNYKLSGLKILKELNRKNYLKLDENTKDKILDFKLQIIEIDSKVNPDFHPVDLFIRLNNKPYPIKENSFEMWNSFADREVIQLIRDIVRENSKWFYIKDIHKKKAVDRMQNEELITMLAYILYNEKYRPSYKSVGYYARKEKITGRISDKKDVSLIMDKLSTDVLAQERFFESVQRINSFVNFLKQILGVPHKEKMDELMGVGGVSGVRNRSLIDFYLLLDLLRKVSSNSVENIHFSDLKADLLELKTMLRNPAGALIDDRYRQSFIDRKAELIEKYSKM